MGQDKKVYRYRIKLTKLNELKFISHLDWQNLILKSLRRVDVKLALSEGFNPMPKISYSPALPIFIESECELVNFTATEPLKPSFLADFQKCISENVEVLCLAALQDDGKRLESLETLIQWAVYEAKLVNKQMGISNSKDLEYTLRNCLSNDDFFIKKVNKKGIEKIINCRSSILSAQALDDLIIFTLKAGQGSDIPALRADEFIKTLFGDDALFNIKRVKMLDKDLKVL